MNDLTLSIDINLLKQKKVFSFKSRFKNGIMYLELDADDSCSPFVGVTINKQQRNDLVEFLQSLELDY